MARYCVVFTAHGWRTNGGWTYETVLCEEEFDGEIDGLHPDWDEVTGLGLRDEESLKRTARAEDEDALYEFAIYESNDYKEHGTNAKKIVSVGKWASEIATEVLDTLLGEVKK